MLIYNSKFINVILIDSVYRTTYIQNSLQNVSTVIEQSGLGATYKPYGLMGFYSSHGVCLHKLFTTTEVSSWGYSLFLNMFNSFCFVFIVVSYSYILTVSSKFWRENNGFLLLFEHEIKNIVSPIGVMPLSHMLDCSPFSVPMVL